MKTANTLENHVKRHSDQSQGWAFACLNLLAILFLAAFALEIFSPAGLGGVVLQATAIATIGAATFILTSRHLYKRLTQSVEAIPETIEAAADRMIPANNLESIGRLAGGVAHDFNNSLMVLLNCIEVMRDAEDSMTRQTLLADMESAARGAQATAEQLMSLSKEGSSPGQPSEPRAALRSIVSNLRRMLPENINVHDHLRGTPSVKLVSGKFEQVILNICLNAKDCMPRGGELTLNCFHDPVEDIVVVEIKDTVPEEYQSQRCMIEESTAYDSVTEVGGQINSQIVEGQGTCIRLLLPIAERCIEQSLVEQTALDMPVGQKRALLLDDNELVLTMLGSRLEEAGYEICKASSIQEASVLVQSEQFDALVCDAILPDGTPGCIIDQFRNSSTGAVVICSGYPKDDPMLADLQSHTAVFLQKPFSTDELIRQLEVNSAAA